MFPGLPIEQSQPLRVIICDRLLCIVRVRHGLKVNNRVVQQIGILELDLPGSDLLEKPNDVFVDLADELA